MGGHNTNSLPPLFAKKRIDRKGVTGRIATGRNKGLYEYMLGNRSSMIRCLGLRHGALAST